MDTVTALTRTEAFLAGTAAGLLIGIIVYTLILIYLSWRDTK